MLDTRLGPKNTKMNKTKCYKHIPSSEVMSGQYGKIKNRKHPTVLRNSVLSSILFPNLYRIDCA